MQRGIGQHGHGGVMTMLSEGFAGLAEGARSLIASGQTQEEEEAEELPRPGHAWPVPADQYEAITEDPIDQRVHWCIQNLPKDSAPSLRIWRKEAGYYEVDGRNVELNWRFDDRTNGRSEVFVTFQGGPVTGEPLNHYLIHAADVAHQLKNGAGALVNIPRNARLSFPDANKNAPGLTSSTEEERYNAMCMARDQAVLREEAARTHTLQDEEYDATANGGSSPSSRASSKLNPNKKVGSFAVEVHGMTPPKLPDPSTIGNHTPHTRGVNLQPGGMINNNNVCAKCGTPGPGGGNFCAQCGHRLGSELGAPMPQFPGGGGSQYLPAAGSQYLMHGNLSAQFGAAPPVTHLPGCGPPQAGTFISTSYRPPHEEPQPQAGTFIASSYRPPYAHGPQPGYVGARLHAYPLA